MQTFVLSPFDRNFNIKSRPHFDTLFAEVENGTNLNLDPNAVRIPEAYLAPFCRNALLLQTDLRTETAIAAIGETST